MKLARWGSYGTPVLVFPTAGGDYEEIERFHLVGAVGELLEAGRVKVYSCDSVNGRVLLAQEGDAGRRTYLLNQFLEYVRWEVVPAIRADCESPDIEIITSGASIGAYNALAVLCRWPDVFRAAICMSGTYDLARFVNGPIDDNFRAASPLHLLPTLDEDGALLHGCVPASSCSPAARAPTRTSASRGASPTSSVRGASPTGSTRGARSGPTTGRPGGTCSRSTSTSTSELSLIDSAHSTSCRSTSGRRMVCDDPSR